MSKGRLPSFRSPRDLTLGGKNEATKSSLKPGSLAKSILGDEKKKKFAPNLNVTRKDGKAKNDPSNGTNTSSTSSASSGWNMKVKAPSSAAKGKASTKPELIQVSGMFSDGLGSENESKKGWARKDADRDTKTIERPKIDFNIQYDKVAEEKKLKALLRDDFIDDLKTGHLVPVQLPMADTGKVFKEETELKSTKHKVKRNRILDSDSDDDGDDAAQEVEAAKTTDIKSNHEDLTFAHLLNEKRSELLFFQLPDHLPGRRAAAVKAEDSSKPDSKVTLNLLSEGYLGKLQLRKSGKVQLWINDVLFDVDIGTQVGFLQELYSVDTNGSQGNMTNLGRVRNRVITMPAWQELFAATAASTMEEEASSSDDDDIVS